jgi:transcriptional regulator with XRE-family HTH domain
MSAPPISMRKLKDLLRLKYEAGLSQRQIAGALRLSLGVVNKYLHAAQAAGITWPLPDDLSESQLRRRLFPPDAVPSPPHYAPVDFTEEIKSVATFPPNGCPADLPDALRLAALCRLPVDIPREEAYLPWHVQRKKRRSAEI